MICLFRGKFFEFTQQLFGLLRRAIISEELLWCNSEVFTNIDEACERWQSTTVFDFINVAFALPQR